jgi:hypothetical protein
MIPQPTDGTLRDIKYKFALIPRLTKDEGLIFMRPYQRVVIEKDGKIEKHSLGCWLNWWTRCWTSKNALRGDGKVFMAYQPRRPGK